MFVVIGILVTWLVIRPEGPLDLQEKVRRVRHRMWNDPDYRPCGL